VTEKDRIRVVSEVIFVIFSLIQKHDMLSAEYYLVALYMKN
jgi:hypothetical protein